MISESGMTTSPSVEVNTLEGGVNLESRGLCPNAGHMESSNETLMQEDFSQEEGFVWQHQESAAMNLSNQAGSNPQRSMHKFLAAAILACLFKLKPLLTRARESLNAIVRASGIKQVFALLRKVRALVRAKALYINLGLGAAAAAYYIASSNQKKKLQQRPTQRVAVIGSGIAGMGAAWTLNRGGKDIMLYEKKPRLGGNAKAMTWKVDGEEVETGLAVLAWPHEYFHNYNALIADLGIECEDHDLRFFVTKREQDGSTECVFAHGREDWSPDAELAKDLEKWDRLNVFVKRVNAIFQPSRIPSMYRLSFINPLNMIPLHTLCRLFGISERFWTLIFVPVHTSTFLEVEMDALPSTMAEILNDILPFTSVPVMKAWKTHSYDTIKRMASEFPEESVRTSCEVEKVRYEPREDGTPGFDVFVHDEDGNVEKFDAVVFACSAPAMNRMLHGKGSDLPGAPPPEANLSNGLNNDTSISSIKRRMLDALESFMLNNTMYTTDRDKTFEKGVVHSNADAVLPDHYKSEILGAYCNYVEVEAKNPQNIENSFVISSWAPTTRHLNGKLPMLVTYNADDKLDKAGTQADWVSTSREAHPCLTLFQLTSSVTGWPVLQGSRQGQTYFCGSAVLPANGHDLSFTSGVVAATQLGAPYPFEYDRDAHEDYMRLRSLMLQFWA